MEAKQIKIFAQKNVTRLHYVSGIILGDILGLTWEIVTDRRKLGKHPVINYSSGNIRGSLKINPDPLLFETGTRVREIIISEWLGLPVFFQTTPDSDLPFDIFAASFFMVSRYEEYLGHQPDEFGRFKASSSLASRHGFLGRPVVDLWTKEFARVLLKKYPTLAFRRNEFKALLTIDIDQPFAYLGKNFLKSFGGLIRDLTIKTGHAGERYKVVKHELKDPYEIYDYLFEKIETGKADARFFFPTGDRSRYDQNPSWKNDEYRGLIKRISDKYQSGLHPSYFASSRIAMINDEILRFKNITGKEPASSRFHYVRLFFPASYSFLAKTGIAEDYSMGYHDEPGFRAGIARPYTFYDISEEKQTNLKIVPFQVMDATLIKYRKLGVAESRDIIINLIDETRRAGGLFVSIWHNTSLLETPEGKAWRELFEKMLQYQQS
jgi:hypothetical protein